MNPAPAAAPDAAVPAPEWAGRLEAAVQQERVVWTPPGLARIDCSILLPASPAESISRLETLLGPAGCCELSLPEIAREEAAHGDPGGLLRQLRRLVRESSVPADGWEPLPPTPGPGVTTGRDHEVFLGFPYLWVPPGFSAGGESPPVLLPLARLPVDVAFDPLAATITLTVRPPGLGCPLEPNPVFLRWLETLTQRPLHGAHREAPEDPWRRLAWLVELADSALEIRGLPHTVQAFQPFPPVEHLPFAPAVLSAGVLGRFPGSAPLWQTELRELLPRRDIPPGPARWFLGHEPAPPAAPVRQPALRPPTFDQLARGPENPALTDTLEQTRGLDLSIIDTSTAALALQTVTALVADALGRDQRVLVLAGAPTAAALLEPLAAQGLDFCCATAADSPLHGPALRREMLSRHAGSPTPPPDLEPPEPIDLPAAESRWQQLHSEVAAAARALHAPGPGGLSFSQLVGEWLELYAIVPPESDEPTEVASATEIAAHQDTVLATLRGAEACGYATSVWRETLAEPTAANLARPADAWLPVFERLLPMAEAADHATGSGGLPFSTELGLSVQAAARRTLAEQLQPLASWDRPLFCARVATATPAELNALVRQRETLAASAQELQTHPLDPELWSRLRGELPTLGLVAAELRKLDETPTGWRAWTSRGGGPLLRTLGLKTSGPDRERARIFLNGLSHRLQLAQMVNAWLHSGAGTGLDDAQLRRDWSGTGAILTVVGSLDAPDLAALREPTLAALRAPETLPEFIQTLHRSADSVRSGEEFEAGVTATGLFAPAVLQRWRQDWNHGEPRLTLATLWRDQHHQLPAALGFHQALTALPTRLQSLTRWHAGRNTAPETCLLSLRRAAAAADLQQRLTRLPTLRAQTGASLQAALTELADLVRRRRRHLRQQAQRRWSRPPTTASGGSTPPTPEELLSGRALLALRPVWLTTPGQALELFAPAPLFNLLILVSTNADSLSEIIPTLLRTQRAVVVTTASSHRPASTPAHDDSGPELLEVATELEIPTFPALASDAPAEHPPTEPPVWPTSAPAVPTSRVHPSTDSSRPSRTAAALGALLRNQFGISTEVHWPDPAGSVDVALWPSTGEPTDPAGWLVDLPDWTSLPAPAPGSEAHHTASLANAGWRLARVWTPDLFPNPQPVLAGLLDQFGIASQPLSNPEPATVD